MRHVAHVLRNQRDLEPGEPPGIEVEHLSAAVVGSADDLLDRLLARLEGAEQLRLSADPNVVIERLGGVVAGLRSAPVVVVDDLSAATAGRSSVRCVLVPPVDAFSDTVVGLRVHQQRAAAS